MAKAISEILKNYKELVALDSMNPTTLDQARTTEDLLAIRNDIERALRDVPFTPEEMEVLGAYFLIDPDPPERNRVNKNGTTSGRPRGGSTQGRIAQLMIDAEKSQNAKNIAISRILRRIYDKLGAYLGDDYDV